MRPPRKRRDISLHNLLSRNSPFSWRSLFAFIVVTVISTALLAVGKLTSNDWILLMQWLGGFFITGEAARKFATKKSDDESHLAE